MELRKGRQRFMLRLLFFYLFFIYFVSASFLLGTISAKASCSNIRSSSHARIYCYSQRIIGHTMPEGSSIQSQVNQVIYHTSFDRRRERQREETRLTSATAAESGAKCHLAPAAPQFASGIGNVAGGCADGRGGGAATAGEGVRKRRWLSGPGSSPPRCASKCGKCRPCQPVHVAVPPGMPVTTEYYPEAWRCKCGNRLYTP